MFLRIEIERATDHKSDLEKYFQLKISFDIVSRKKRLSLQNLSQLFLNPNFDS